MRKEKRHIDKATIRAKREGYRARSVYKLLQINKRFQIIRKNDLVLDLGSFPGSWLQAIQSLGGKAVGVDIKPIEGITGADFLIGDVMNKETIEKLEKLGPYDCLVSDLAPNPSGVKGLDHERSYMLAEQAFLIARRVLKKNGNMVCKIFQGEGLNYLIEKMSRDFKLVRCSKPEASKMKSKEMYIVAKGLRKQAF